MLRPQVDAGQFRHLPRAQDQHVESGEIPEDFFRERDRRVAHRHGAFAESRLGSHALADGERAVEQAVGQRAGVLEGARRREGVLHLPQDLRLADHHRVQAGRHAEGVADGLGVEVRVEDRLDGGEVETAVAAEVAEGHRARLAGRVGHAVDFHTIARREHDHFRQHAVTLDVAQELAELVLLDGELLAQRDGRVLVAHAGDEERHQEPCRPGRNRPAPSVSTRAAKPTMAK